MIKIIGLLPMLSGIIFAATNPGYWSYHIYDENGTETKYNCFKDYLCSDSKGTVSTSATQNTVYSPYCVLMDGDLQKEAYFSCLDVLLVTKDSKVTGDMIIIGGDGGEGGDGDPARGRSAMTTTMQALMFAMEIFTLSAGKAAYIGKKLIKKGAAKATEEIAKRELMKKTLSYAKDGLKGGLKSIKIEVIDMMPNFIAKKFATETTTLLSASKHMTKELYQKAMASEMSSTLKHTILKEAAGSIDKSSKKGLKKISSHVYDEMLNEANIAKKATDNILDLGAKELPKASEDIPSQFSKKLEKSKADALSEISSSSNDQLAVMELARVQEADGSFNYVVKELRDDWADGIIQGDELIKKYALGAVKQTKNIVEDAADKVVNLKDLIKANEYMVKKSSALSEKAIKVASQLSSLGGVNGLIFKLIFAAANKDIKSFVLKYQNKFKLALLSLIIAKKSSSYLKLARPRRGREFSDVFYGGGGGGGGFGWDDTNGIGIGGGSGGDGFYPDYMTKSGKGGKGSYGAGGGGGGSCSETVTAYWIHNVAGGGGDAAWFCGGGGGGAAGTGNMLPDWPEADGFGGNGSNALYLFNAATDKLPATLSLRAGGGGGGGMRASNFIVTMLEMIAEIAASIFGGPFAPLINATLKSYYWGLLALQQAFPAISGEDAVEQHYGSGGGFAGNFQCPFITPCPIMSRNFDVMTDGDARRSMEFSIIGQQGIHGADGGIISFDISTKIYASTINPTTLDAGTSISSSGFKSYASGGGGGGGGGGVAGSRGGNSVQRWESGISGGGGGGTFPSEGGNNETEEGSCVGGGGWGGSGGTLNTIDEYTSNGIPITLHGMSGGDGGRGFKGGNAGHGGGFVVVKSGATLNFGLEIADMTASSVMSSSARIQTANFLMTGGSAGKDGENQGGNGGNGGGVMVINGKVNINPYFAFIITAPTPQSISKGKAGGHVQVNSGGIFNIFNSANVSTDIVVKDGGSLLIDQLALSADLSNVDKNTLENNKPLLFGYQTDGTTPHKIDLYSGAKFYCGLSNINFNLNFINNNNSVGVFSDTYNTAYFFQPLMDTYNDNGVKKLKLAVWNICCDKDTSSTIETTGNTITPFNVVRGPQKATKLSLNTNIKKINVTKVTLPNGTTKYGYLDATDLTLNPNQALTIMNGGTLYIPDGWRKLGNGSISFSGGTLEYDGTSLSSLFSKISISGSFILKTTSVISDVLTPTPPSTTESADSGGISSTTTPTTLSKWIVAGYKQTGKSLSMSSNINTVEVSGYFDATGLTMKAGQTLRILERGIIYIPSGWSNPTAGTIELSQNSIVHNASNLASSVFDAWRTSGATYSLNQVNNSTTEFDNIFGNQTTKLYSVSRLLMNIENGGSLSIDNRPCKSASNVTPEVFVDLHVKNGGKLEIASTSLTSKTGITVEAGGIICATNATAGEQPLTDVFTDLILQNNCILQTNFLLKDDATGTASDFIPSRVSTWYIGAGASKIQKALAANQFENIHVLSGSTLDGTSLIMESGKELIVKGTLSVAENGVLNIYGTLGLMNQSTVTLNGSGETKAKILMRPNSILSTDKTSFSDESFSNLTIPESIILKTVANVTTGFKSVPASVSLWQVASEVGVCQFFSNELLKKMPKKIFLMANSISKLSNDINIENGYFFNILKFANVTHDSKKITVNSGGTLYVANVSNWELIKSNFTFELGSIFAINETRFNCFNLNSFTNVNTIQTMSAISDDVTGVGYTELPSSVTTWNICAPFSSIMPQKLSKLFLNTGIKTINVTSYLSEDNSLIRGYINATSLMLASDQNIYIKDGGIIYIDTTNTSTELKKVTVESGGIILTNITDFLNLKSLFKTVTSPILQTASVITSVASDITDIKAWYITAGTHSSPQPFIQSQIPEICVCGDINSLSAGVLSAAGLNNLSSTQKVKILDGGTLLVDSLTGLSTSHEIEVQKGGVLSLNCSFSNLTDYFDLKDGAVLRTNKVVDSFSSSEIKPSESASTTATNLTIGGVPNRLTWYINAGESAPQTLGATINATMFNTIEVLPSSYLKWTGASLGNDLTIYIHKDATLILSSTDSWPTNVVMLPQSKIKNSDLGQTYNWVNGFKKHVDVDVTVEPSGILQSSNVQSKVVSGNEISISTTSTDAKHTFAASSILSTTVTDFSATNIFSNSKLTFSRGAILKTTNVLADSTNGVASNNIPVSITDWYIAATAEQTAKTSNRFKTIKVLNGSTLNAGDMTVPQGQSLLIDSGGKLKVDTGKTLNIAGILELSKNLDVANISGTINIKKGSVLRTNITDFTDENAKKILGKLTLEPGVILQTTDTVATGPAEPKANFSTWRFKSAQDLSISNMPTILQALTNVNVSASSIPVGKILYIDKGAILNNDIDIEGKIFIDRNFDMSNNNRKIKIKDGGTLVTNRNFLSDDNIKNVMCYTNSALGALQIIAPLKDSANGFRKFSGNTNNIRLQTITPLKDDANGVGQIPASLWIISSAYSNNPQTANFLSTNTSIKNIEVATFFDGSIQYNGYLDATRLTLRSEQILSVVAGGTIFIPDALFNNFQTLLGNVNISKDGILSVYVGDFSKNKDNNIFSKLTYEVDTILQTENAIVDSDNGTNFSGITKDLTWYIKGGTYYNPQKAQNTTHLKKIVVKYGGALLANNLSSNVTSVTVEAKGRLLLGIADAWPAKVTLKDGAFVMLSGTDATKPSWYDGFITYISGQSSITNIKTYMKYPSASNAKITNSTTVF